MTDGQYGFDRFYLTVGSESVLGGGESVNRLATHGKKRMAEFNFDRFVGCSWR